MRRPGRLLLCAAVLMAVFWMGGEHPSADYRDYRRIPDFFDDRDDRALVADAIDIQILDDKVLAIQDGQQVLTETLKLDEQVLWQGTKGLVGLVVTTDRLLAVSTAASNWIDEPLRFKEVEGQQPRAFISDFLVLVVTVDRLLGFSSKRNHWVEADVSLYDRVTRAEIDRNVAVVVTTERAWGLAVGSPFFDPIKFLKGEKVLSVETSPLNVNILTNKRLLVFKSVVGVWQEFDKDLF